MNQLIHLLERSLQDYGVRRFTEIHAGDISIIKKLLASCALAALTFAAAPRALKAADNDALCPLLNATLHGTYMVTGGGTVQGFGLVAAVGTISYDGKGNSVNTFTASGNGTISKATLTGPYTVSEDCTGSLTQSDGSHYDFVVNPDGSTVFWIETDAGTIVSGTEIRFKHSTELVESRNRDSVPMLPLPDCCLLECHQRNSIPKDVLAQSTRTFSRSSEDILIDGHARPPIALRDVNCMPVDWLLN